MSRITDRRALKRLHALLGQESDDFPHLVIYENWLAAILGEPHPFVAQEPDIDECRLCGRTRASFSHIQLPQA